MEINHFTLNGFSKPFWVKRFKNIIEGFPTVLSLGATLYVNFLRDWVLARIFYKCLLLFSYFILRNHNGFIFFKRNWHKVLAVIHVTPTPYGTIQPIGSVKIYGINQECCCKLRYFITFLDSIRENLLDRNSSNEAISVRTLFLQALWQPINRLHGNKFIYQLFWPSHDCCAHITKKEKTFWTQIK